MTNDCEWVRDNPDDNCSENGSQIQHDGETCDKRWLGKFKLLTLVTVSHLLPYPQHMILMPSSLIE